MDTVSYLLGKKAGGGTPTPISLQDKEVTITQNGETEVKADSGYDGLNKVDITTNVPQPSGKITITENGTDINVSSYATADVSVSGNKFAPTRVYFSTQTTTQPPNTTITGADIENNLSFVNLDNAYQMFYNCTGLDNLDMSGDTPNTKNNIAFNSAFYGCTNLETLDLSNFTGNVNNYSMWGMFIGCTKLREVNLSNLKCSADTNVGSWFNQCSSMEKIDIRSMDLNLITNSSNYNNFVFKVPNNCLIIVKNNSVKSWVLARNSSLTNVKTVAEL